MKKYDFNIRSICYKRLKVFVTLIFVITISELITIFAQTTYPEAKIAKMIVETKDLIVIQISISKNTFILGDNIPINYQITNKSNKVVYLVVEPSPQVFIDENYVLELVQPVTLPDDHMPYDYDLVKIPPQKTYKGNLSIDAKSYLSNKKYDFEIAKIRVGFSYLFDKSNLEGCKKVTFVRPCLKALYDKSKSLTIGNLIVEIKKH